MRSPEERSLALKERIYASFTGLAIVASLAIAGGHGTAWRAFFALAAGIIGITAAAFVAEVVAVQLSEKALPSRSRMLPMIRIAVGAIATASLPLVLLLGAGLGLLDLPMALQLSIGIYFVILTAILFVAAHRTGLPWRQRLIALAVLIGLGVIVILILIVGHSAGHI